MSMNAVVTQSPKDNQWYGEFKAENHETWWVSEGYPIDGLGVNSVTEFCERIGATVPIHVKVIDKYGTVKENFEINHAQAQGDEHQHHA